MQLVLLVLLGITLTSCVSDIDIQLPDQEPLYVVEGWMEQGGFPHVIISETMNFNSKHGIADLFELVITDAEVTLKTHQDEEKLKLVQDTMYTILPIYRGYRIRGEVGQAYTLEVKLYGKTYTSTDTIQPPVPIDSLWFIPEPGKNGKGNIHMSFQDPQAPGNFYRLVTKRLGKDLDYYNVSGNILGDHLFNGKKVQFPLVKTLSNVYDEENEFFGPGETVVVKICTLTAERYSFLVSISNQLGSTLSPISIQSKTISLMDGGALGGWSCFGVSTDTLRIQ